VTATDPQHRLGPVIRLAPAKLNLTLAVLGRRPDGYHDIHSVMVPLALADRLSVAFAGTDRDTLHVTGADTGPPADNLVLRAIAAARTAVGRGWAGAAAAGPGSAAPALAVRLAKSIPVTAGLAGGSSDSAAAVDAALEAWAADLDPDRRLAVAASVGSDVPFFLAGGPALVEGRGERVTPLTTSWRGELPGILLVTPRIAVSTAVVFGAFAGPAGSTRLSSEHLAQEWRAGLDTQRLVLRAGVLAAANDLLAATAAVAPDAQRARRALVRLLGRPVGQSGSGPTCWVLYPSLADARVAADRILAALTAGELQLPGDGPPFVLATTFAAAPTAPAASPGRSDR
jgi:4-diphosphocytidyl-2-C-methyl-D-erythritol kinase